MAVFCMAFLLWLLREVAQYASFVTRGEAKRPRPR